VVARTQSAWTASADPELVYAHRPGWRKDGVAIESHGILRPERRCRCHAGRPGGAVRLALVGDSVGAAIRLQYDERVATQLERRLSEITPLPVEVLNFLRQRLRHGPGSAPARDGPVAAFEPRAVLVLFCLNTSMESTTPVRWFRDPVEPVSHLAALRRRAARRRARSAEQRQYSRPLPAPQQRARRVAARLRSKGLGWRVVDQRAGAASRAGRASAGPCRCSSRSRRCSCRGSRRRGERRVPRAGRAGGRRGGP
jgi:hypothetical protein